MTYEASDSFPCFGSTCSVYVIGDGGVGRAAEAVAWARRTLHAWHDQFTRFSPDSELSRLNADPHMAVPVSPMMARFVAAVVRAAELTGGLVDATLLGQLEANGYVEDLDRGLDLAAALRIAPPRAPAGPAPAGQPAIEVVDGVVRRPPGLMLDSGGLAKGLFADVLARRLAGHPSFAVDCAGDVRVGGSARLPRPVHVDDPFGGPPLHTFRLVDAGIATSGIGRRSWLDEHGRPAHHLLDPATGRPAYTGVVQATAIAPTALEAEMRAKAAVLAGPDAATNWIPHGGMIVLDDGRAEIVQRSKAKEAV
jgi:thiamine biosynthesis lipoprotein